jgi:myosin heavy subunit
MRSGPAWWLLLAPAASATWLAYATSQEAKKHRHASETARVLAIEAQLRAVEAALIAATRGVGRDRALLHSSRERCAALEAQLSAREPDAKMRAELKQAQRQQIEKEMRELELAGKASLEALRADHARKLAAARRKWEDETRRLQANARAELDAARSDAERREGELNAAHAAALQAAAEAQRSELEVALSQNQREADARVAEWQAFNADIEGRLVETQSAMERMRSELNAMRSENQRLQREAAAHAKEREAKRQALTEESERLLTKNKEITQENDDLRAIQQKQSERIQLERSQRLLAFNAQGQLNDELTRVRDEMQARDAAHASALRAKEAEVEALRAKPARDDESDTAARLRAAEAEIARLVSTNAAINKLNRSLQRNMQRAKPQAQVFVDERGGAGKRARQGEEGK